jgi:hypothetical protein
MDSLFPPKKLTVTEWAIEHFKTSMDFLIKHPQYVIILSLAFRFRKQIWNISTNTDSRNEFITKSFEFINRQQSEAKELVGKLNNLQKEWMDKFYKTGQAYTTHELARLESAEKHLETLRAKVQIKEQVVHEMEKTMIENSHITKTCENDVITQKNNYKALYDYVDNIFKSNPSIVKTNLPALSSNLESKMISYTPVTMSGKEVEKKLVNEKK